MKHTRHTWTRPSGTTYTLFESALEQCHLLIAGATGSGKSVFLNGMISTALYDAPGDNLGCKNFIFCDQKGVELMDYQYLPHTLRYAVDTKNVRSAFKFALNLVEKRFREMSRRRLKKWGGGDVYLVIDEFADTAITCGRSLYPTIQRIAQLGRAARVHIVLCTQVPNAKILPTEIRCNFVSRIGLRTASRVESRILYDDIDLSALPHFGQCVFRSEDGSTAKYNVPYIRQPEIDRLTQWWAAQ